MSIFTNFFRIPPPDKQRTDDLVEAQRDLLKYEATVEYAVAMRDMLKIRVARLSTTTKEI